jgi:hypothetical protein
VPQSLVDSIKLYCDAFFLGMKVVVKYGGDEIEPGVKLPKDFYDAHNIKFRDDEKTKPDR